jgi:hypothetical protein
MTDASLAASRRADTRDSRGGFAITNLPTSIRDAVRGLDKDGTGFVEEDDFVAAVEQMVQQRRDSRRDSRLLKQILAAVVALNLLLTAAVVGCAWGLAAAARDTNAGDMVSVGGTLTDKATGAPVRTAAGFVPVGMSVEADADVLALWANADGAAAPSRYAAGGALEYVASINGSAVALACELLAEGRDRIVASVGSDGLSPVSIIHSAVCPAGGAGAEGLVVYEGRGLIVRCPADLVATAADAKCHVFRELPANATGAGAGGATRRSLLGAGDARAPIHVIAGALQLRCDAGGECQVTGSGASARRHLSGCEATNSCAPPGDHGCFPADSLVTLASGERRRLRDLAVGDAPLAVAAGSGALVHSAVYVFPHFVTTGLFPFKRLSTAAGANITATPDHYMLVGRGAGAWTRRAAVPARDVRVGDVLWVAAGAGARAALLPSPVVGVADVMEEGIVNPLTLAGTIVVDGVAASVYNDMLGSNVRMHAFCVWGRALWRAAPSALKALHRAGWAPALAMGAGRAARAALVAARSLA